MIQKKSKLIGRILILPLFLAYWGLAAQTIEFKDKESKLPLSYIEINYNSKIFYTDSLGKFNFVVENANRNFQLTDYQQTFKIPKTDSLVLIQDRIKNIEKVEVRKKKLYTYRDIQNKKSNFIFGEGTSHHLMIKNNDSIASILNSIELYTKKVINKNFFLKIDFYKNNESYSKINTENIIFPLNHFKNNSIKNLDLTKYKIILDNEGVLMNLKIISNIGENTQKNYSNEVIHFYSSEKDKDYLYLYNYSTRKKIDAKTIYINLSVLK